MANQYATHPAAATENPHKNQVFLTPNPFHAAGIPFGAR
jgi:hypothetical protein